MGGVGCAGYVVQVAQAMWWPVQTNNIARLGLSQVSQSEPSVAINIGGTVQQAMLCPKVALSKVALSKSCFVQKLLCPKVALSKSCFAQKLLCPKVAST